MKQTITAVIPAKNEAHNIQRCLESLTWCDKIMVMWMGNDKTGDIARNLGADVIEMNQKSEDDFVAVQENVNWAGNNCKTDWILRVDADEVVEETLATEIQHILENPDETIAYGVPRKQYFMGGFLIGGDWAYDRLIRLYKPDKARYKITTHVHEQLEVDGKTGLLQHALLHYSHPTLKDARRKFQLYTDIQINDVHDPLPIAFSKVVLMPFYVFLRWMLWHHGYKDGIRGIIAGAYRGWYEYLLYSKYLKKQLNK